MVLEDIPINEENLERIIRSVYSDHCDIFGLYFQLDSLTNYLNIQDEFFRKIIDTKIKIIKELIIKKPYLEKVLFYQISQGFQYFTHIFKKNENFNVKSIFEPPRSEEEKKDLEKLKEHHLNQLELFKKEFIIPHYN